MIYESEKMTLKCVMKVFSGKVNDVEICENVKNGRSTYYTLHIIKDHEVMKKLMNIIGVGSAEDSCYVDMFDSKNGFCVVFDYVKERRLSDFFMARDITLENCEDICLNLIVQCMTTKIPYPLLNLILKQKQLQLLRDNGVAIGYAIDLADLDEKCTEEQCVMECALIVRDLLEKKVSKKNIGYKLLEKRIPKKSYISFRELYKDIRLCSSMVRKRGIISRIRAFIARNDTSIFKVLLIISIILALLALVVLVSRSVWGEIPLLRFFIDTFKTIGTESLRN